LKNAEYGRIENIEELEYRIQEYRIYFIEEYTQLKTKQYRISIIEENKYRIRIENVEYRI